jgi:glucose-1-phosphate thymidylyltransferase
MANHPRSRQPAAGEGLNALLFEDPLVARLDPVTTGRAAFAVSCGSYRLIDLLPQLQLPLAARVRHHLRDCLRHDFPDVAVDEAGNGRYVCVNARLAPACKNLSSLNHWVAEAVGRPHKAMLADDRQVLAAVVDREDLAGLAKGDFTPEAFVQAGCVASATAPPVSLECIEALHDLIRIHEACLTDNLQHRLQTGDYREVADGVFCADPDFRVPPQVAATTTDGPIVLESNCSLGPFAFLEGPLYLGSHCQVNPHAAIKAGVSAGTTCKLGGEMEAVIVEGYTNKQHHGFLGHSHVGSWINLGAGTCNSDLKNTYGPVNMQRHGRRIRTEMQFIGCFIGDYAKTAINTSIFTGKTIGVCSMVYGFAAANIPSFCNYAAQWGKVTEVDPRVMVKTQARMFERRAVPQRHCDQELITAMFDLTREERTGLTCEPLVF